LGGLKGFRHWGNFANYEASKMGAERIQNKSHYASDLD